MVFRQEHSKHYHEVLHTILENGVWREDPNREGTKRLQIPHVSMKFDMEYGFPLLTTKKMWWKGIVTETLWILSGESSIKPLVDNHVHIWDKDAYNKYLKDYKIQYADKLNQIMGFKEFIEVIESPNPFEATEKPLPYPFGGVGRMYGVQWRNWDYNGLDQLERAVHTIKTNPLSSNIVIFGDNPADREVQALPCCMNMMQFIVEPVLDVEYLDMTINYRSWDYLLGAPWNIAQYALILEIIAKITGKVPGCLRINAANVHLYGNQIEAAEEQLERSEYKYDAPSVSLPDVLTLNDLVVDNAELFILEDYKSYPPLENQPGMIPYS